VRGTGRAETVFVLLLIQAGSWLLAALSAGIAALAGQPGMGLLALLTVLLATATGWLGVALLYRLRRARRLVLGLEWICLVGSVLVWLLPGNAPGPVALLMGAGLPVCVLWLLHGKRARTELARTLPSAQQLLL
jgi:cyanate permease